LIGKNLGNRYRVLREIGSGGMAKVYLAEDLKGNELIAVKVLYPQFSEDMSFVQRFLREAKLASTLTDPHIVRVLDYGADRDLHYLVMEYVEGQNLYEILEEKSPFEWKVALEIIDQVATALEHAYTHGVVHRDIKPQNMMLTESGLLKILDFGIARIPTLPSLTQSGLWAKRSISALTSIRQELYCTSYLAGMSPLMPRVPGLSSANTSPPNPLKSN
jgi:serine/threonine-protein kinase